MVNKKLFFPHINKMHNLQNAPPDVFANIALSLSYNDLEQLCRTNPNIRSLCNNDQFWYQRTRQDFRNLNKPNDLTWKEYYINERRREKEMQQKLEQVKYLDKVERKQLFKVEGFPSGVYNDRKNRLRESMDMLYESLLTKDLTNTIRICNSTTNSITLKFCQSEVFWYDKILFDCNSIDKNQLIADKPINISWREYYIQLINKI